jgi:hypothetical protein
MEEEITRDQDRLLDIAGWAKHIAWLVLTIFVLSAVWQVLGFWLNAIYAAEVAHSVAPGLWNLLMQNPVQAFSLMQSMAVLALRGLVYFLLLKGVSLGLFMIVEIDINSRKSERTVGVK